MEIDNITGIIINTALGIHKGLGPGLLESVYEMVLVKKLEQKGLKVSRQYPVDFEYEGMCFRQGFRLDLFIENKVIIELKSVEKLAPVHAKQLLTYMRLLKLEVGLLINFGEAFLKNGIKRVINNYTPSAPPREPK